MTTLRERLRELADKWKTEEQELVWWRDTSYEDPLSVSEYKAILRYVRHHLRQLAAALSAPDDVTEAPRGLVEAVVDEFGTHLCDRLDAALTRALATLDREPKL